MPSTYHNVMFVCTANVCRSVLAEAWLRKRLNELKKIDITVTSAGTASSPLFRVPGIVKRLLKEEGVQFIEHKPRTVTTPIIKEADLVLAMSQAQVVSLRERFPESADKIKLLKEFAQGLPVDIGDPVGTQDETYKKIFEEIKSCIESMVFTL
jgi:protein arginine phosphatase